MVLNYKGLIMLTEQQRKTVNTEEEEEGQLDNKDTVYYSKRYLQHIEEEKQGRKKRRKLNTSDYNDYTSLQRRVKTLEKEVDSLKESLTFYEFSDVPIVKDDIKQLQELNVRHIHEFLDIDKRVLHLEKLTERLNEQDQLLKFTLTYINLLHQTIEANQTLDKFKHGEQEKIYNALNSKHAMLNQTCSTYLSKSL